MTAFEVIVLRDARDSFSDVGRSLDLAATCLMRRRGCILTANSHLLPVAVGFMPAIVSLGYRTGSQHREMGLQLET